MIHFPASSTLLRPLLRMIRPEAQIISAFSCDLLLLALGLFAFEPFATFKTTKSLQYYTIERQLSFANKYHAMYRASCCPARLRK